MSILVYFDLFYSFKYVAQIRYHLGILISNWLEPLYLQIIVSFIKIPLFENCCLYCLILSIVVTRLAKNEVE